MAPKMFSKFMTSGDTPSIYQTLREYDEASEDSDVEGRAGMGTSPPRQITGGIDGSILATRQDNLTIASPQSSSARPGHHNANHPSQKPSRRRRRDAAPLEPNEADDDVPMSLLIEMDDAGKTLPPRPSESSDAPEVRAAAGVRTPRQVSGARWQAKQNQEEIETGLDFPPVRPSGPEPRGFMAIDPREKALWRWANVENLDNFLAQVYDYYLGKGIWSVILNRILNLLTIAFVVGFSVFLSSCIDYSKLRDSNKMSDIYVPKCGKNMSGLANALLWFCAVFWLLKFYECLRDIPRLKQMQDFYQYLLDIPDADVQTVSWQDVVRKLMTLRDANPATVGHLSSRHRKFLGTQSKQRMDAVDIANRLMRRENYLIALFNKDILDLTVPLPGLRTRPVYSRTLEWTLSLCILDYIFDDQGQVRSLFMKSSQRKALSVALRRRFFLIGLINIFIGPVMITYILALYFFRNFSEFQKEPSSIGSRQYTPFAEWKFREFNELRHMFERRMNMSYPFASRYVNQFPKDKTVQLAKFVSFVAGALTAVLAVTTLVDPDLFLGFEITPDKTVLFYLGIFTTVWAVSRGMIPEEFTVFDPKYAMQGVIEFTHYQPSHWEGRLHSDDVRQEFSQLYKLKVVVFLEEVLSMITTPFILCFSLPDCSERIVDFVREFTVHVDGLGHVCSFAVFDFHRGGNTPKSPNGVPKGGKDLREEYYAAKDGKMLASYYNFMDQYVPNHGHGQPGSPWTRPTHALGSDAGPSASRVPLDASTVTAGRHLRRTREQAPGRHGLSASKSPPKPPHSSHQIAQVSSMASVLLDPQHQPFSSQPAASRSGFQTRSRQARKPTEELLEDEEDEAAEVAEAERRARRSETLEEEQSHLGESWKMSKAGSIDEVDEGIRGPATNADNGAGILGLVYQFSKAQTEGRAAGV